jgi:hypothetical protein
MTSSTDQGPSLLSSTIWTIRYAPGAIVRAMADGIDKQLEQSPTARQIVRVVRAARRDLARLI